MDSRPDYAQDDSNNAPPTPTEEALRAALAESAADMAAGRIVPGEVILRELHDAAEQIEVRRAARRA
jgi:hypothetical protein